MAILEPVVLVRHATVAFDELRTLATWVPSLDKASVDPTPLLVTSIADPVTRDGTTRRAFPDYGIVSIRREAAVTARFALHAETGRVLEAEGVRHPGTALKPYVDAPALGRSLFPGAASMEVVWRPCRESTTRFLPFWRFLVQGHWRYLRADGKVYDELTTTGRG